MKWSNHLAEIDVKSFDKSIKKTVKKHFIIINLLGLQNIFTLRLCVFQQHVDNSSASPPKVPSTLHQPKFVLLLAYQRVGSSFTGKMFNANPDMLYVYEPLDGVYTRLYGTVPGWAVPSDLHFHWNVTWMWVHAFYPRFKVLRRYECNWSYDLIFLITCIQIHIMIRN